MALLVRVIHHFTDEKVVQVLERASELTTSYVLVIDVLPKANPASRFFYSPDRGAHIRTFHEQRTLIERVKGLQIIVEGSFESTSHMYTHSVLLSRSTDGGS